MATRTATVTETTIDERVLLAALTALKRGDFSARLPADWRGLSGRIADAFNEVVELNDSLAAELERVSRVVGKEGKTADRASLGRVSGAWAASVGSVNALITDMALPTAETARVIGAVAMGDLSQRVALGTNGSSLKGEFLASATTVNAMGDQLTCFACEGTRVAR